MPKYFRNVLLVSFGVGCVLLVLLIVISSRNVGFFERHYQAVLWSNIIVTIVLAGLSAWALYRIIRQARKKRFGFKLLSKFALAMGIAGVLPGILIFTVSIELLYGSIDFWFDENVEKALDSGLTLGREVLESYQSSISAKARDNAVELSETPPSQWISKLHELSERENYAESMLVTSRGNLIGVSGSSFSTLVPAVPSARALQSARDSGFWQTLEEQENGTILAKTVVIVPTVEVPNVLLTPPLNASSSNTKKTSTPELSGSSGSGTDSVYLEVAGTVPPSMAHNAEVLMSGYREYQEMMLTRSGQRTVYFTALSLVFLLSLFVAAMVSLFIANQINKPLRMLLEGTRKVGSGTYEQIPEVKSRDEVGELTQSFNAMTQQLADARQDVEKREKELEQANDYLGRILSKMSSGVIVADERQDIVSVNPSASRILQIRLSDHLGRPMREVIPEFLNIIKEKLPRLEQDGSEFVVQDEIMVQGKTRRKVSLFIRGTSLPLGDLSGMLLVFDDVTSIVAAQRADAWTEVARRLAHEIKNPLTPIQLAAERMQMRLTGKLGERDDEVLQKATRTIVSQVSAMKQMVDDFRIYARIGSPSFQEVNLSEFVEDVASLYLVGGTKLNLDLEKTAPLIEADENQLRQALHNLLSNSMEATPKGRTSEIEIKVKTLRSPKNKQPMAVEMSVSDNGIGFSDNVLEHVFEPYVTTKSSGTGLGLAMIKKIVDEHSGTVAVENRTDDKGTILGAKVSITFTQLAQNREKRVV